MYLIRGWHTPFVHPFLISVCLNLKKIEKPLRNEKNEMNKIQERWKKQKKKMEIIR